MWSKAPKTDAVNLHRAVIVSQIRVYVLAQRAYDMKYENDANLDPATWLLFEILRTVCVPASDNCEPSAKVCLKQYKKQFQAAIRLLVWLQLAAPNRKNALGCDPTDDLMSLIAGKPKRWLQSKRTTQICEQRDALETIIELALKKDALDETLEQCAVNLLGTLGLVRHQAEWGGRFLLAI